MLTTPFEEPPPPQEAAAASRMSRGRNRDTARLMAAPPIVSGCEGCRDQGRAPRRAGSPSGRRQRGLGAGGRAGGGGGGGGGGGVGRPGGGGAPPGGSDVGGEAGVERAEGDDRGVL